jgi:hypothetical protein
VASTPPGGRHLLALAHHLQFTSEPRGAVRMADAAEALPQRQRRRPPSITHHACLDTRNSKTQAPWVQNMGPGLTHKWHANGDAGKVRLPRDVHKPRRADRHAWVYQTTYFYC